MTVPKNEAEPPVNNPDSSPLRLFIVGETSGDPADWGACGSRSLVAARSIKEALEIRPCRSGRVAEVILSEPGVIFEEDIIGDES